MRSGALWFALALAATLAHAASFVDTLNEANAKLLNGESQSALDIYRELQVENPESDVLYHNLGCAQYLKGEDDAKSGLQKGQADSFNEAKASFERAMTSDDPVLRKSAAFNRANAIAKQAMAMDPAADQEAVIAAFEDSIKSYEDILSGDPANKDAQTNLDHMRYLLKKMLQNPPDQNQQQQQGQDDQQKQGEQQDQQQDQKGGEQDEQQPQQQDRQEQSKSQSEQEQEKNQADPQQGGEQEQADKPESQEQQSAPQNEEKDKQNAAAQAEQDPNANAQDQQDQTPKDMQAIEALLQSLDDQDQREQVEMRRAPRDTRLRGDWW